jgi:hypothetical protein
MVTPNVPAAVKAAARQKRSEEATENGHRTADGSSRSVTTETRCLSARIIVESQFPSLIFSASEEIRVHRRRGSDASRVSSPSVAKKLHNWLNDAAIVIPFLCGYASLTSGASPTDGDQHDIAHGKPV